MSYGSEFDYFIYSPSSGTAVFPDGADTMMIGLSAVADGILEGGPDRYEARPCGQE